MKAQRSSDRGRGRGVLGTWIVLLPLAAVLMFGCGGGGGGGTSSAADTADSGGGALTKTELIEQGDAICAKVYAVTKGLKAEGTPSEAVRFAELNRGMVKDLLALGNPRETEYSYAEYTVAAKAFGEAEDEVVAARGDPATLKAAESSSLSAYSLFQGNAGQYGFKTCGGE